MTDTVIDDGLLRAKPPRPSMQLGRNKVLALLGVFGVILTVAIILGNPGRRPKKVDDSSQVGSPGYKVTSLASSYDELPVPTPVPQPRAQYVPVDDSASKLDALLAKIAEEKLKRADRAQKASVNFQNISLPRKDALPLSPSDDSEEGSSAGINPRDESNRQDEKNSFLTKKHTAEVSLKHRIISPRSPYQLMAGTLIPGLLLTGLNSDLPGQILGQVSQNVFDTSSGNHLLVPQGTKVIGQYDSRIVYGQERVLIVWTRLIFPNGKSISLEGMPGVDLSGYAGLSDQVNNHWGRLLTGVIFSSLLSASAQMAEGRNYSTIDPSYGELATQGVARNANQVGQEITRRNLNIQPTLEIRPGFRFNVFVHKDMILEPYKK
jgi:type IV secretory pathway VirB10-like protein